MTKNKKKVIENFVFVFEFILVVDEGYLHGIMKGCVSYDNT